MCYPNKNLVVGDPGAPQGMRRDLWLMAMRKKPSGTMLPFA